MTRNEFLEKLASALSSLSGSERSLVLEYYDEMISDRMEEGMSEAEAVEAMGSIDQILDEAAPEAERTFTEEAARQISGAPLLFREPVQNILANTASANLVLRCALLPDGVTAMIELNLSENLQCRSALNHGRLEIFVENVRRKGFSLRDIFSFTRSSVTVTLAESVLERAELNASSGDAELAGLTITDCLSIGTASGNIALTSVKVGAFCSLHTTSGNITATSLTGGDEISVETASGDFRARNLGTSTLRFSAASGDAVLQQAKCNHIETGTASGDIRLTDVQCNDLSASSASGDITLNACAASGEVNLHTSSGDIRLNGASAGRFDISTTSGDIRGSLNGQYAFCASSRSGDIHVPASNGTNPVNVRSTSGDITLRI